MKSLLNRNPNLNLNLFTSLRAGALVLLLATSLLAQENTPPKKFLERLNNNEFSGGFRGGGGGRRGGGGAGRWVDGGKGYTTAENGETVRYDLATGKREVLPPPERSGNEPGRPAGSAQIAASPNGEHVLFSGNGRPTMIRKTAFNYWVFEKADNSWHKLGGKTNAFLLYAKLSPDGTKVAYVQDNNICVEEVATGTIKRLTTDGSESVINGASDWVNEEEFSIRDAYEWSPDGKRIAYLQFDQSGVPEFALINYTDTLYPVITKYPYPKPGQTNAAVRLGVVDVTGGATKWVNAPGDPRNTYIPRMDWAGNSDELILQHLNRLQSTNHVFIANAKTGEVRTMFEDRDDAWAEINERFVWLEQGKRLLFESERDGWRHAYSVSRDGDARLITTGAFDMISVSLIDEAGGWLYYMASPENATQRYLYRSKMDGTGQPERLTPKDIPGTHTYTISPDAKYAFHSYSRFDGPGPSDLVSLPDHKVMKVFQDNADQRQRISAVLKDRTEMVQATASDGVKIDGWIIRPSNFDPSKKYPVILNIYGEPAATTVNDSWNGGRLMMAGLADDGYIIGSFDNRGTPAPKGRDWRKKVYGAVGVLSSQDQAEAIRDLAKTHPYIDLERVGVYGWSGGGSMTLNLMFRHPELYKVGVAGAPVPDQTLYDSIYQERYMGLPQDNPNGYRDGSPITFAGGLKGKLLIIHGTGDDNVHFQGTQRLVNKLISLNKQFSFMEYPNRRHGISGSHLDNLRYGYLEDNLPAGGR